MMIEPLEPRRLLAGKVGVTLASGVLQLTGDDSANQVLVETSADGSRLTLTGEDGTTVAGRTRVAYDFAGAIVIRLAGGDDVLRVRGARFSNGVGIELGAGDDVLDVKQSRFAAVDVFGNAGDDTAAFSGVTATGRLRVFPGLGADTTGLRDVRARVGLDVSDAGTRADIGFIRVSASGLGGKSSYVGTSGSSDRLQILDSDFEAFSARLNAGNDTAYVRGTTFKTASPIDGGSGTNDINREVILSWDFNNDTLGWAAGLADVPYNLNAPLTTDELFVANGGSTGTGILNIGGADRKTLYAGAVPSPYAFTYWQKEVGTESNVTPGEQYEATFDAVLGTSFYFDNTAYLYAGVTDHPVAIDRVEQSGTEKLAALNITLGANDTNARDWSLIGEAKNGEPLFSSDSFDVRRQVHFHRTVTTTDRAGSLWVGLGASLVGSGNLLALQLAKISVELTPARTL